ncbi:hypothetical protein MHBO_002132 [Bonamia ostreae]|uniref:PDZ domain-containing protein n=1 Tax=Bonamia ostreae TaxID=126728 RepID=A0ABV2AMD6_9EUKA
MVPCDRVSYTKLDEYGRKVVSLKGIDKKVYPASVMMEDDHYNIAFLRPYDLPQKAKKDAINLKPFENDVKFYKAAPVNTKLVTKYFVDQSGNCKDAAGVISTIRSNAFGLSDHVGLLSFVENQFGEMTPGAALYNENMRFSGMAMGLQQEGFAVLPAPLIEMALYRFKCQRSVDNSLNTQISHLFSNIKCQPVDESTAGLLNVPLGNGVRVSKNIGALKADDVILAVNGQSIDNTGNVKIAIVENDSTLYDIPWGVFSTIVTPEKPNLLLSVRRNGQNLEIKHKCTYNRDMIPKDDVSINNDYLETYGMVVKVVNLAEVVTNLQKNMIGINEMEAFTDDSRRDKDQMALEIDVNNASPHFQEISQLQGKLLYSVNGVPVNSVLDIAVALETPINRGAKNFIEFKSTDDYVLHVENERFRTDEKSSLKKYPNQKFRSQTLQQINCPKCATANPLVSSNRLICRVEKCRQKVADFELTENGVKMNVIRPNAALLGNLPKPKAEFHANEINDGETDKLQKMPPYLGNNGQPGERPAQPEVPQNPGLNGPYGTNPGQTEIPSQNQQPTIPGEQQQQGIPANRIQIIPAQMAKKETKNTNRILKSSKIVFSGTSSMI